MKDEDIDLSDIPEITPEMFKGGVRNKYHEALKDGHEIVSRRGRPPLAPGQEGDAPITSVRFPPALLERLRAAAAQEGVGIGDIIRRAVEHELAHSQSDATKSHLFLRADRQARR